MRRSTAPARQPTRDVRCEADGAEASHCLGARQRRAALLRSHRGDKGTLIGLYPRRPYRRHQVGSLLGAFWAQGKLAAEIDALSVQCGPFKLFDLAPFADRGWGCRQAHWYSVEAEISHWQCVWPRGVLMGALSSAESARPGGSLASNYSQILWLNLWTTRCATFGGHSPRGVQLNAEKAG